MEYKALELLVIGLGSMGKRRIRNATALGLANISGFDTNPERLAEVKTKYPIVKIYNELSEALKDKKFDAFIISVPPDLHHIYMKEALKLNVPAFIEASVVDDDLEDINITAGKQQLLLAPSCTLIFHPAIKFIRKVLKENKLGNISNIIYHSGQFLPDWHSYEKVSDYYVSKKETGGAREIVPFELTWLTMLLGFPVRIAGMYKKTIEIEGAEAIDDTYNTLLDYESFILNLSVDVVSRTGTRRLTINGDRMQLYWNWDDGCVKLFEPEKQEWQIHDYTTLSSEEGYNKNITEQMYIEEMDTFLNAVINKGSYPNTLANDLKVLDILKKIEQSNDRSVII